MVKFPFKNQNQAVLLTDSIDRRYFSGISVSEGYLILTKNESCYFTDARYNYAVSKELDNTNIKSCLFTSLLDIKNYLIDNGVKELFINFDKTFVSDYNSYSDFGIKIFDCSKEIKDLRKIKTENEIDLIKKSCKIVQDSIYATLKYLKVGISESEYREILIKEFVSRGADGESFDSIIAFGENSAVPHHVTGNTKLENNSVILIDTGCFYKGYASDITRTLFFGNPSKEFIFAYNSVLKANELAEENIVSNVLGVTADKFARDYLNKLGFGEYFTHSLGHGIGLEIHETPYLSKKSVDKLTDNMVFSVEPGVYFNGKFGIRIEDTVILQNGKLERLFNDDKNLIILWV